MLVYRDCLNGQADFDDPAAIALYDGSGSIVNAYHVPLGTIQFVPNVINSPCLSPPNNVCVEAGQYVFTINIPSGLGPCTIVYQRCCRNEATINVANVDNTGATFTAVISDPLIVPINSNPVFNALPPPFICKDSPFSFDLSATDADGDSMVYELSTPLAGGDEFDNRPDPPPPPPYQPVSFVPPYSINNFFGGVPLQINSSTGLLQATPNSEGQFVYGVTIKEYRNGILIGETTRDFQLNVVSCPALTVASVASPLSVCGTLNAQLVNNSYNAFKYKWDFGDPNSNADTSSLKNPVYTYPAIGQYQISLIAYSSFDSTCNDTVTGIVNVYPPSNTDFYVSNFHCSEVFSFFDMSTGTNGTANFWSWNFGDNTTSSQQNPVHSYNSSGQYNVTLIASVDPGCLDTMVKSVNVLNKPVADFNLILDTCTFTISTTNLSSHAVNSRWEFGDVSHNYLTEGSHTYRTHGNYDLLLTVVSDSACMDTTKVNISIPPLPVPGYSFSNDQCDSTVEFFNNSIYARNYVWDFGDNEFSTIEGPLHTYSISGWIPVKLTAISDYNCRVTNDWGIYIVTFKESNFTTSIDSCNGLVHFKDSEGTAAMYLWDFDDGTTSTEKNPVHKFNDNGNYNVSLVVNNQTLCADTNSTWVNFENPYGEKVYIPNSFTPNGDGHNDYFELSIFRPCEVYKISIFNRWGQKVFESDDATMVHWDGSFAGDKLPADIYLYLLENNGEMKDGFISILR